MRALHAAVNGDVAAIAELKSKWDDLDVKGKKLTAVCAEYKSLLASAARNFEFLQRKAKQKSLPAQSHYEEILSQEEWFYSNKYYRKVRDLFVLSKSGQYI